MSAKKRTIPLNMPENWEPPVPGWSSDSDKDHVFIAYYGIQNKQGSEAIDISIFRAWFNTLTSASHAPQKCDYAEYIDSEGYYTWMAIGYWPSADAHKQWTENSEYQEYWASDDRLTSESGVFCELLSIPTERFENLFSHENLQSGSSGLGQCPHSKKIVKEHNYWGGMRDRIELSGTDPMDANPPAPVTTQETKNRRLSLSVPLNCAVIRSGQNLENVEEKELQYYQQEVEPHLVEGMAFLDTSYDETGCYNSRLMTETDASGNIQKRTFGLVYFVSLRHMEEWAKSHPTHLKIFTSFLKYAGELGPEMQIRLWHEVVSIPEQNPNFEYINCHNKTGLLTQLPATEN